MKTFTKVIMIFSSIFFVLGVTAIIVAIALGAKFNNNKLYETYDFTHSYTDVTLLNIEVDVGEVIIKEGTEFKIDANDVIKDRFESSVENGVWTIKETGRKRFFLDYIWDIGNWGSFNNYSPKITIYIPESFRLDKFDISLGAGKGTVEKIDTKFIRADVGAGELLIYSLISNESDINCGVGSISINGVMNGNNKIDNGVGSIKLNLKGNENDYNYKYDIGIGEVVINNRSYSKGTDLGFIDNKASNNFDLDCGVGSIEIEIKE